MERHAIPRETEAAVLTKSARRCMLCFRLKGDLAEKSGQIAHLDHNRSNYSEDNLGFMCLEHHSLYDSKTSQHKNFTLHEVKAMRDALYVAIARGDHLRGPERANTGTSTMETQGKKADRKVLEELRGLGASIEFLRGYNFAGFSFERAPAIEIDSLSPRTQGAGT